jgi:hypothetical protein
MSIFLSGMQASDMQVSNRETENNSKGLKRSNAGHVCMSHAVLKQKRMCNAMMKRRKAGQKMKRKERSNVQSESSSEQEKKRTKGPKMCNEASKAKKKIDPETIITNHNRV